MKSLVIVDTSSFVNYFNGSKPDLITLLAAEDLILLSKVVRLELLKGTAKKDRKSLISLFEGFQSIEELAKAELVEKVLFQLHGRGLNLGFADLLILADAIRTESRLLTADLMLAKSARILGVPVL